MFGKRVLAILIFHCLFSLGCERREERVIQKNEPAKEQMVVGDPFKSEPGQEGVNSNDESGKSSKSLTELMEEKVKGEWKVEVVEPPFQPPISDVEARQILQDCLAHLLTDAKLQELRDEYGRLNSKDAILEVDSPVGRDWPNGFQPSVDGWDIRLEKRNPRWIEERNLAVRLEKLDLVAPTKGILMSSNVTLVVTSTGGVNRDGAATDGCFLYYSVDRRRDRIAVKYAGTINP